MRKSRSVARWMDWWKAAMFSRPEDILQQVEQVAQNTAGGSAQLAYQAQGISLGSAEAQSAGCRGFHVMAFVDDQVVVLGENAVSGGNIREQQGMVDNQDMRALGDLPGAVEGTPTCDAGLAGFGFTSLIFCRKAHPHIAFRGPIEIDFSPVAAVTFCCQTNIFARTRISSTLSGPRWRSEFEPARAEVIASPFQDGGAQIEVERLA